MHALCTRLGGGLEHVRDGTLSRIGASRCQSWARDAVPGSEDIRPRGRAELIDRYVATVCQLNSSLLKVEAFVGFRVRGSALSKKK